MLDEFTSLPIILFYELKEKEEEGCEVEEFKNRFRRIVGNISEDVFKTFGVMIIDKKDEKKLRELYEKITNLEPPQKYEEPFELRAIFDAALCPKEISFNINEDDLKDRIHGAWLGRCIGCLLGKPVEAWTKEEIESYLKEAGEFPLQNYFPKLNLGKHKFHPESAGAFRGHITHMIRDDDIDYTVLNLNVLEKFGRDFTSEEIALFWLQNLPYKKTYTAERVAYRNFVNGIWPPESGRYYNPYREWIGAQIRGDVFGWINPGKPRKAAEMAYRDAVISHRKNGIYGEMFVAAASAAAVVLDNVIDIIEAGLSVIPKKSRLAEALKNTIKWSIEDDVPEKTFAKVVYNYGGYHPVHTIINAAIVVLAVVHGRGDFERSICTAVMCGCDTDCNGATVGSIVGAILGASNLPHKWTRPLNDTVESAVVCEPRSKISGLAKRTFAIARELLQHGG